MKFLRQIQVWHYDMIIKQPSYMTLTQSAKWTTIYKLIPCNHISTFKRISCKHSVEVLVRSTSNMVHQIFSQLWLSNMTEGVGWAHSFSLINESLFFVINTWMAVNSEMHLHIWSVSTFWHLSHFPWLLRHPQDGYGLFCNSLYKLEEHLKENWELVYSKPISHFKSSICLHVFGSFCMFSFKFLLPL